jgi:hypothetical protein
MLSSVLRSERAIQMNSAIMRAFVRLRELMAAHKDIAARVEKLERGQERTASVIEVLVEDWRSDNAMPACRTERRRTKPDVPHHKSPAAIYPRARASSPSRPGQDPGEVVLTCCDPERATRVTPEN